MLQRHSFNSFIKYPNEAGTTVTISQKENTLAVIKPLAQSHPTRYNYVGIDLIHRY